MRQPKFVVCLIVPILVAGKADVLVAYVYRNYF